MGTEIYESQNVFAGPSWKTDADLQWTEVDEYEISKHKVEARGTINDYIAEMPEIASLEGRITAMRVEPDPPEADKLVNSKERLRQLAKKRALVLVLNEQYAGYLGISRVEFSKGVDDGYSFVARVSFAKIQTTTAATAQIPASKLRAKVKKRAATGKKGGAAKPSTPSTKSKTVLKALKDGAAGFFGRFAS